MIFQSLLRNLLWTFRLCFAPVVRFRIFRVFSSLDFARLSVARCAREEFPQLANALVLRGEDRPREARGVRAGAPGDPAQPELRPDLASEKMR